MIQIFDGAQINSQPALRDEMFRHRAAQFVDRLGWPLTVDAGRREIDQYDAIGPLYLVSTGADGRHRGSLRLLPTMGRTMTAEHFAPLAPAGFADPRTLECTRFCIAPDAPATVSAELFLGVLDLGLSRRLKGAYGVFDARMMRVYQRLGTPTKLVSTLGEGKGALCLGYFDFDPALRPRLAARAAEDRMPLRCAA